ncbi:hypothetical protein FB451DRAFT_74368 [Mycena latifolia]|nr:hypothetical protein FB451DRAFT_74368 [Mycena latifolia]
MAEPITRLSPSTHARNGQFPSALPTPSNPIQRVGANFQRELFEPLHIDLAAALIQLPPLESANNITDYRDGRCSRAGTCSPMELSPNCSPTKFILPLSPNLDVDSPAPFLCPRATDHHPTAFQIASNSFVDRRSSENLSSTSSSHMSIPPCSSPTKDTLPLAFGQEGALPPTRQHFPDILCSSTRHRHPGASDPSSGSHLSRNLISPPGETHNVLSETVVAQGSTFFPGKTVSFTFKQPKKALRTVVNLA